MAGVRIDGTAPFAEPSARCYAGAARADMTPPVGMYTRMWGAALHDCHTAVHKPLLATALVIVTIVLAISDTQQHAPAGAAAAAAASRLGAGLVVGRALEAELSPLQRALELDSMMGSLVSS